MKKPFPLHKLLQLLPLLLMLACVPALAEWLKINPMAVAASEKFIDTTSIRQTGPMNTMRRVWEMSNLAKGASSKVLSIKNLMEYDCKDRRVRVLEESHFSEHWAQGENLTKAEHDNKFGNWTGIDKGSLSEIIFNRVCPNDDSDSKAD